MRLVRFGRRVINIAALLEAEPTRHEPDRLILWMAGNGYDGDAVFRVELRDHEVEAFYTWLQDNSDLVTSIEWAPKPAPALVDDGDGHDHSSIPF